MFELSIDAWLENWLRPAFTPKARLGRWLACAAVIGVLGAALVLKSRSVAYFAGRGEILDLLERQAPGSVSVLEGHHREELVIVNLVPDSTLSSNRFSAAHGGAQAFGYDLWRSREVAQQLFPLPSQALDRERFIHARVMLTIATLMALTDGSLPVVVRLPG